MLAGKHCESGDVIVREALLDDPRPGDVVVTPATGAYGYAMANNYNGVPRPPVIFCRDGDARVVVRRETLRGPHRARRAGAMSAAQQKGAAQPAAGEALAKGARPFAIGLLGWARWDPRCRSCSSSARRTSLRSPVAEPHLVGVLTRERGSFEEILERSELIVELMGGIEPAREYVLAPCAPAGTS